MSWDATSEVLSFKERLLEMVLEVEDLSLEAETRLDIAIAYYVAELPSPSARKRVLELFEAALAAAQSADHPAIEARAHAELGELVGGEAGRGHLEACLDTGSLAASRIWTS